MGLNSHDGEITSAGAFDQSFVFVGASCDEHEADNEGGKGDQGFHNLPICFSLMVLKGFLLGFGGVNARSFFCNGRCAFCDLPIAVSEYQRPLSLFGFIYAVRRLVKHTELLVATSER